MFIRVFLLFQWSENIETIKDFSGVFFQYFIREYLNKFHNMNKYNFNTNT